jgi:hypothetical protein
MRTFLLGRKMYFDQHGFDPGFCGSRLPYARKVGLCQQAGE